MNYDNETALYLSVVLLALGFFTAWAVDVVYHIIHQFKVAKMYKDFQSKSAEIAKDQADQRAKEDALISRINEVADGYVDNYIRRQFPEEVNDIEFADKLKRLVAYAFEAQISAKDKIFAEESAQEDLNEMYNNWPARTRGRA